MPKYRYRQALSYALVHLLRTVAAPAINAELTLQLEAEGVPTDKIPQFDDKSITRGDLTSWSGSVICVQSAGESCTRLASEGIMRGLWVSRIDVKTTQLADSRPEDFATFLDIVADGLRDVLTVTDTDRITPVNPSNNAPLLPGGAMFKECFVTEIQPINHPNMALGADGKTYHRGLYLTHIATLEYTLARTTGA